ncbi:hypothetical protein [Burkholderia gladioli]|uniref:hypothetical protein n=1 Tax=Burkholderia gladioli TaxID=28095 RepID=UPI0011B21563|nr:hypothetical protein [Burkholderia gladioli]
MTTTNESSKPADGKVLTGNAVRRFFVGDARVCSACGHQYFVTESMVRNRYYPCSKCASKKAVEYARKNREKKRAWNNAYSARNSAKRADRTAAWRANHPQKRLAHQAVQSAVRNGSLIKLPCAVCGQIEKVHAHHDDYSKPLDVIWLCHKHHMERHTMLKARG